MTAYRVTIYGTPANNCGTLYDTLAEAYEATGYGYVVGPEDGPEPGKPWYGHDSPDDRSWVCRAKIERVDLPG